VIQKTGHFVNCNKDLTLTYTKHFSFRFVRIIKAQLMFKRRDVQKGTACFCQAHLDCSKQ
jgi:hypothetical protein